MIKKLRITINGEVFDVQAETLDEPASLPAAPTVLPPAAEVRSSLTKSAPAGGSIFSPMSGKLVAISVKVGDLVNVGDVLATVEAMKMNTYIHAESPGHVAEVLVVVGDGVEEGQVVMIVK